MGNWRNSEFKPLKKGFSIFFPRIARRKTIAVMVLNNIFTGITKKEIKNYTKYWSSIAPKNDNEIFQRWLFAYTSIHTTWQANVRGYNAIKNFDEWINDKDILLAKLIEAKCGMFNVRTNYIWDFSKLFFNDTSFFHRYDNETWVEFRNRLVNKLKGIGMAKVSFTLEMCYPTEAQVVCLDVHMLRLYEAKENIKFEGKNINIYHEMELDWINRTTQLQTAPCITRSIFWDKKQNQSDPRYWSYVLEN